MSKSLISGAENHEKIIIRANWLLAENPKHTGAMLALGMICSETCQLAKAISWFQQALEIEPNLAEARFGLAICLNNLGNPSQAIEHYQKAGLTIPHVDQLYNWLGDLHFQQGNFNDALKHYQKASNLKSTAKQSTRYPSAKSNINSLPQTPESGFSAAISAFLAEDYDQSLICWEQLIKQFPDSPEARLAPLYQGRISLILEDWHPAVNFFQTYLEAFPDSADGNLLLALSLTMSGEYRQALEYFKPLINSPDSKPSLEIKPEIFNFYQFLLSQVE